MYIYGGGKLQTQTLTPLCVVSANAASCQSLVLKSVFGVAHYVPRSFWSIGLLRNYCLSVICLYCNTPSFLKCGVTSFIISIMAMYTLG